MRLRGGGAGTIPSGHSPQAPLRGRVGEGRGWGILGCGLVTQWWLPCKGDTTARGGATQPDSSLNCQGLAASSWCEGLECGRPRLAGPPPGPPRPHSAKVNSFCSAPDVLNICHTVTLSCLLSQSFLGQQRRDMTQTINFSIRTSCTS